MDVDVHINVGNHNKVSREIHNELPEVVSVDTTCSDTCNYIYLKIKELLC